MEKKFEETLDKCVGIMNDCGFALPEIDFKLNNRLSRTLGRCGRDSNGGYDIEISTKYATGCIETANIRQLEQTILHELCHTLPKAFNHGSTWKKYTDVLNNKYDYNISRLSSVPNEVREFFTPDGVLICCDKCKREDLTPRNREVVSEPSSYRCICGGKLSVKEVE